MKTATVVLSAVTALVATATAGLAAAAGNRHLEASLAETMRELNKTKRELADARTLVLRDPLTGLASRAALYSELTRRLDAFQPFSLYSIDLDNFKPVNDTFGHPVGDLVLAEVARRLLDGPAIGGDVVGRLGGDEFMLIADSHPTYAQGAQAPAICHMLRAPITVHDITLRVTASVGLLQVLPGDDLDDCVRSVDAAMYRAKGAGGDQWAVFGMQEPLLTAGGTQPPAQLRHGYPNPAGCRPQVTAGVMR